MKNNARIKEEMYPRFGKYKSKNYMWGCFFILVILFSIIKKEIHLGSLIVAIIFALLQTLITHKEMYRIQNGSILTKKLYFTKKILLPEDIILIIARGNKLAFPYRRLHSIDHLIELYDCYMVCIVGNCTPREVLNMMRWNKYSKENRYSNVFIREVFLDNTYSDFLYSFVFDAEQVQKLVENHQCQIILPKSLEGKVDLSNIHAPIFVDENG